MHHTVQTPVIIMFHIQAQYIFIHDVILDAINDDDEAVYDEIIDVTNRPHTDDTGQHAGAEGLAIENPYVIAA